MRRRHVLFALLPGLLAPLSVRAAERPSVVAAENFYADVARQVAGPGVTVTAILSNPDQDPHLFEASPATARAVRDAQIAIVSGAGYDPWMSKLLRAAGPNAPKAIVAADLVGRKEGQNPHIWYDPATMPAVATAIAAALSSADPANAAGYGVRLAEFKQSLQPLLEEVAALRQRFAGLPVTATEPVFGDMAAAIGLEMRNGRFQLAVQNDSEPRPSDVAAFEADLRGRRVRVLLYNSQADDRTARRMVQLAKKSGVPVVPVTETMPPGATYQSWMLGQLKALGQALGG